jgi:hypothetical protein
MARSNTRVRRLSGGSFLSGELELLCPGHDHNLHRVTAAPPPSRATTNARESTLAERDAGAAGDSIVWCAYYNDDMVMLLCAKRVAPARSACLNHERHTRCAGWGWCNAHRVSALGLAVGLEP